MEVNNPLYRKQGIHVIASIFTVENGIVKVLLIQRKHAPFQNMWALVGGALHNDEDLEVGLEREILEKTGIGSLHLELSDVFGKLDRSPVMRMVAISYVGIIDYKKVSFLKQTLKTNDASWFDIRMIPKLAYDHEMILTRSLLTLQELIGRTDILKALFPDTFTLPELQNAYEVIWNMQIDRRNFRKRLLHLGIIEDTMKSVTFEGKKPAKLYRFCSSIQMDRNIF